jgi:ADP-ribosylglycohydrolase
VRTVAERARDAVRGAFVADAAACGLHWIYDVEEVRRRGDDAPEFMPPSANPYHGRRRAGESTHYGDHALVMLESLVLCGRLDAADYRARFLARFRGSGYDGYLDQATKDLLRTGRPAADNQAGCLAKLPPLVARYRADDGLDALVEAAILVTHDHAQARQYGLWAAAAIREAIRGRSASEALEAALASPLAVPAAAQLVRKAPPDHVRFALKAGQACPVPNAVPVALHAALHARDFKEAVRNSILAGGDSAGRLLLAGAIRGATDGVPEDWLANLAARDRIDAFLAKL